MNKFHEKNLQFLLDNLKKVDILIAIELIKFRRNNEDLNIFQGSFISDEEIDSLLSPNNEVINQQSNEIANLENSLINLEIAIDKSKSIAIDSGIELRLLSLAKKFNLTDFEMDCLLITLAPAISKKYEKFYGYLNDDITKKQATVDLILNLLCFKEDEKLYKLKYFGVSSNLFKNNLLEFVQDDSLNLLSKSLKIDDRIANYLLANDTVDLKIHNKVNFLEVNVDLNHVFLSDTTKIGINTIEKHHEKERDNNIIILIQGNKGHGKKTIAREIANQWKIPLLEIDISSLINDEDLKNSSSLVYFEKNISHIFRESLLQNSAIYLEHFNILFDGKNSYFKAIVFKAIKEHENIIFLGTNISVKNLEKIGKKLFKIEIPKFSYFLRKKIWKEYLKDFNDDELSELSNKFKFSPSQIKDVKISLDNLLAIGREEIKIEDVYTICREQFSESLSSLAKKVEPKYKWNDLILPEDTKEQLIELKNYIKNKGIVFYDWGFIDKLSLGKGTNILFSGSSGTGKTMAAEIIASDLALDLYKIDLSMIVSKYVGETEKNLNKIFEKAENSNAILFFDEADALFGKRTELSSSHDRYSNIEVSYLLQKMEEHEGVVIMATNLIHNMDDAFLRRIHFSIEFPFPDSRSRKAIWEGIFPRKLPIENDIDFDFLSSNFKLSGSNIKNSAILAAFYAAEDNKKVSMDYIIQAVKREYQKIGKAYSKSDFMEYFE